MKIKCYFTKNQNLNVLHLGLLSAVTISRLFGLVRRDKKRHTAQMSKQYGTVQSTYSGTGQYNSVYSTISSLLQSTVISSFFVCKHGCRSLIRKYI